MAGVENKEEEECVFQENVLQKVSARQQQVFIIKWNCVCINIVVYVPEIRRRCPFQSQTGHVHGSIHQQKENGHNAGDGVKLPWEQHQLGRKNKTEEEAEKEKKNREKKEGINIHSSTSI